jgi:hypothetical protein
MALPILASAIPGIAEIMGDQESLWGVVVPIADVTALERLLGSDPGTGLLREKASPRFSSVCWRAIAGFPAGAGGGVTEGRIKL